MANLTKNLVTFKRQDGVKDEKLDYGSLLKDPILTEGHEKEEGRKKEVCKKERVIYLKGVEESS